MISDDGVGFCMDILKEKGHVGIKNVRERLYTMCGGILSINSKIGEGTDVFIMIPKNGGK